MFTSAILRSTGNQLFVNPLAQYLCHSFNTINAPLPTKQVLIDPHPPLVGQAIEIKEHLRQNTVTFDESWTCIKALCCRSSTRMSGLIYIGKERGREDRETCALTISLSLVIGDFACSKCPSTGTWEDLKNQWQDLRSRSDHRNTDRSN